MYTQMYLVYHNQCKKDGFYNCCTTVLYYHSTTVLYYHI